jgi:hypothetical protein
MAAHILYLDSQLRLGEEGLLVLGEVEHHRLEPPMGTAHVPTHPAGVPSRARHIAATAEGRVQLLHAEGGRLPLFCSSGSREDGPEPGVTSVRGGLGEHEGTREYGTLGAGHARCGVRNGESGEELKGNVG